MSDEATASLTSITTGILPLKLNTGADRREIDRARMLITSIRHYWRGSCPFDLHVVCRDDEFEEICQNLGSLKCDHLHLIIHKEGEFFAPHSSFHTTEGMYKQQLIKLFVPVVLQLNSFITLDADVLCIRDFKENSFVVRGKIVSTWEPRAIHSWWQNSMCSLRAWSDIDLPGLGVTPNTLHGMICKEILQYFNLRGLEPLEELCALTKLHPKLSVIDGEGIPLAWSEYSIYTIVGEWFGSLFERHLTADDVAVTGVRLHSNRNVWSEADLGRLKSDPSDSGHFLVVQSWSGISIEEIVSRLDLPI